MWKQRAQSPDTFNFHEKDNMKYISQDSKPRYSLGIDETIDMNGEQCLRTAIRPNIKKEDFSQNNQKGVMLGNRLNNLLNRPVPPIFAEIKRTKLIPCKQTFSRSKSRQPGSKKEKLQLLQQISEKLNAIQSQKINCDAKTSLKSKASLKRGQINPNIKMVFHRQLSLKVNSNSQSQNQVVGQCLKLENECQYKIENSHQNKSSESKQQIKNLKIDGQILIFRQKNESSIDFQSNNHHKQQQKLFQRSDSKKKYVQTIQQLQQTNDEKQQITNQTLPKVEIISNFVPLYQQYINIQLPQSTNKNQQNVKQQQQQQGTKESLENNSLSHEIIDNSKIRENKTKLSRLQDSSSQQLIQKIFTTTILAQLQQKQEQNVLTQKSNFKVQNAIKQSQNTPFQNQIYKNNITDESFKKQIKQIQRSQQNIIQTSLEIYVNQQQIQNQNCHLEAQASQNKQNSPIGSFCLQQTEKALDIIPEENKDQLKCPQSEQGNRFGDQEELNKFVKENQHKFNNDILQVNVRRIIQEQIEKFWNSQEQILKQNQKEAYNQQENSNQTQSLKLSDTKSVQLPVTLQQGLKNYDSTLSIQQFIKGKRLGKGMFGQVFIVQHIPTNFLCALKIINKQFVRTQKMTEQLIQQLKIHTFIRHPNIVEIYGYFSDNQNVYIMQQLCTGGQLFDLLIKRRRISEKRTAYYMKQLAQGLRYLQTTNIVHRDIKPENILIQLGVVKICDFGWALHSLQNQFSQKCGTPLYMSPEVVKGDVYSDQVDMWGLGLIAYELLIGNIPWNIWTQQQTQKIVNDELTFPSYVPISVKAQDFIRRALTKDPKERMTMLESFSHDFFMQINPMQYQNQSYQSYGQATP